MKFLIIAYSEIDGVGQHAISLNTNLNKIGHESKTLLLHKSKINKDVILIKRSFFKRMFFFILEFFKKDIKTLFSFGNSTINFKDIKNHIDEAEVIIIYSLHKILSFSMLKKILNTKKPIYIRPLDMELATGGCHVNTLKNGNECIKYESNCINCPLLNVLNIQDLSNTIFNKKKIIFDKYKPKIFLENNFTKKIYDSSPITKNSKTETIFLGVNHNRTNFFTKEDARKKLNIAKKDKIILFGTFNLDAPHKGGLILESILKNFISIVEKNNLDSNKIKLITFGRKNSFKISIPKIDWQHMGLIDSSEKLNLLYRSADVFASPSTGCNGPHVILEALLNDLPVVAFEQGVAQDSIINSINGYLTPCFDKEIFANSILKALFNNDFNFQDVKNKRLKDVFNSTFEAESIIKHAEKDLNITI